MPAIIEADDLGTYVLKFRGAGQGPRALIAELVAGELARAVGLPVPEIVFVELDPELARTEPDQEIQDLIRASAGLNLALDYLPGSLTFDPLVEDVDAELASSIVWFDAFVTNVDRTPRNPNMLMWHQKLWLIDHGASLYFHHSWHEYLKKSRDPFAMVKDHVLLPHASTLAKSASKMTAGMTPALIARVIDMIPDAWLEGNAPFEDPGRHRDAYLAYFNRRLESPFIFLEEAIRAQTASV